MRDARLLNGIIVNHSTPTTTVGSICRHLIFPNAMVARCRAKWRKERQFKYLFSGLPTAARGERLKEWCRTHHGRAGAAAQLPASPSRLRVWAQHALRGYSEVRRSYPEIGLHVFCSNRGRRYPVKVWDDQYFSDLGNSRFVLCPNGDFVWTYRFYEAILCGAVPIVEEACPMYEGYEYHFMSTPVADLAASEEITRRNFDRAVADLTVSRSEMDAAIIDAARSA